MPTLKPRVRAYNIKPGEYVTIVGALHGEVKTGPMEWYVKDIVDHDPETYLEAPAGDPFAAIRLISEPAQRTLLLRPATGDPRGTYLHTVPRTAHITLASA